MDNNNSNFTPSKTYPQNLRILTSRQRRELPNNYRRVLLELEAKRLANEIKILCPPNAIDRIVEARIQGKVFLLKRYVRCGKSCKKCPHGPYWYGFYRHHGKFISFYLGKILPLRFTNARLVHIQKDHPERKELR